MIMDEKAIVAISKLSKALDRACEASSNAKRVVALLDALQAEIDLVDAELTRVLKDPKHADASRIDKRRLSMNCARIELERAINKEEM